MPEPSEEQIKAMEKRQGIYDAYYRIFTSETGKIVLEDMKRRASFYTSTFFGDGLTNRGIRDYREGQRNLMLETDAYIERGRVGVRPPVSQATSNTAEA